jgi:Domain of unknown function (DUF4266)
VKALVLLALLGLVSAGCTHVRPWQRSQLTHHAMTAAPAGVAAEHVYAVHEGATGGGAAAESGCGCN